MYIYVRHIYLGSKRSFMHVLLKRMAHSLFIIFFRVFSYFLISFILLWSFCKISIIVLKDNHHLQNDQSKIKRVLFESRPALYFCNYIFITAHKLPNFGFRIKDIV